jgi:hypothetical protein
MLFTGCYLLDTEPPSEFDCQNICKAKVKAAQAECREDVKKAKDTCVREAPPRNGSSRQLSSRSYSHPRDGEDMLVETKVRVWKNALRTPQRVECFYYDGDRTDAYLKRDSTVVQVGETNPLDVTIIARLRKVPDLLRVGQRMVRTECGVLPE